MLIRDKIKEIDDETAIEISKEYIICDAHTHIFPEKIAKKAVSSIGDFYNLNMSIESGCSDQLINDGKKINTKKYVVCSVATTQKQVESINRFLIDECQKHNEFIGLMALHPDYENIEAEVNRCIDKGLCGVKIHPDFQTFNIDDEKAFPIYESIRGKLPILIHMGDNRYDYSSPKRLERINKLFPDLVIIAAHFGGYTKWKEAYECNFNDNVFFDTSSSLNFIDDTFAKKIIDHYGKDRIFFGTDFPMWDHLTELKRFLSLELDKSTERKILGENLLKFFKIKGESECF